MTIDMVSEIERRKVPGEYLLHPVTLIMLSLWFANDHWWKVAYSGWFTGKISDIASLVVCPLLVTAALEIRFPKISYRANRYVLGSAITFFGCLMVAIKLWEPAAWLYQWGLGLLQWPLYSMSRLVVGAPLEEIRPVIMAMDPTDLITLPSLGIAWAIGRRESELRIA
jgi:hypothetical protein